MKCLRCGYPLKSKESEKTGIGGYCRHKGSNAKSKWQNKVKRTIDYENEKPISLDGGKSYWEKTTDNIWANNKSKSSIGSIHFDELLKKTHSILMENEYDKELLSKIKNDLDGFFNNDIDKD